jgi:hypothetical protein
MPVLCINESGNNIRFTSTSKRGQADKFIAPGDTVLLSDEEWQSIAIGSRGPGGARPLWPATESVGEDEILLDYLEDGGGTMQLRYHGSAPQGTDTADALWTIKQFTYADVGGGSYHVTEIQVLHEVAWGADQGSRDALAWT